ncbi:ABC transporter ATP-binding protein [Pseudooceanicola nanhaiensis]|uniref:ABC transporter ATP-binding protein n=1 Tax=Pseudooceanicola nanhaiensis TaxID=375761 RepID=UPI001CD4A4CC|nr:ABC transporter ATP-binding protein [Pseudooceanicola nanhaiensis]MCA0921921.1 ABC transporter ATP-binding protein [Pseudooceanicola nanhaiensis]
MAQVNRAQIDSVEEPASRPEPLGTPLVVAKDLDVTFHTKKGRIEAVKGLSLNVGDGEFVSILGPSGCGKSTLLRVAAGLLKPSGGALSVGGETVAGPRSDVGVVFQKPALLPWKTVLDNVTLPVRSQGLNRKAGAERARRLLDMVGLAHFAESYPSELSGGMQQRVGIVRGLVNDPKVLLMDEPFSALDAMTRETMMDDLQRIWNETRKTVMFITHSIPEAVYLSDRVIVLSPRPARLVEDLTIDLPRPRTMDTMSDARFTDYTRHLRGIFSHLDK